LQTYQADIRPVFLDDDTETTTVSKSGWTGLGEFLSNDAISQKMHKQMRIQEWELRLVMEMCNKGTFTGEEEFGMFLIICSSVH
jgi:hypothetical protein